MDGQAPGLVPFAYVDNELYGQTKTKIGKNNQYDLNWGYLDPLSIAAYYVKAVELNHGITKGHVGALGTHNMFQGFNSMLQQAGVIIDPSDYDDVSKWLTNDILMNPDYWYDNGTLITGLMWDAWNNKWGTTYPIPEWLEDTPFEEIWISRASMYYTADGGLSGYSPFKTAFNPENKYFKARNTPRYGAVIPNTAEYSMPVGYITPSEKYAVAYAEYEDSQSTYQYGLDAAIAQATRDKNVAAGYIVQVMPQYSLPGDQNGGTWLPGLDHGVALYTESNRSAMRAEDLLNVLAFMNPKTINEMLAIFRGFEGFEAAAEDVPEVAALLDSVLVKDESTGDYLIQDGQYVVREGVNQQ